LCCIVLHIALSLYQEKQLLVTLLLISLTLKNNKNETSIEYQSRRRNDYYFTIHVDAYNYLCSYLDSIERPIKNAEVAERVLSNYESKMVKLFEEQKRSNTIVNMADIRSAIDTLGSPEIPISALYSDNQTFEKRSRISSKRRLYRDRDNKVIGGVASGLADYLGIHDPIWVRIAFVVMMMAGFASVPVYAILWIAMPYADSRDRKGETLDLSNTADRVALRLDSLSQGIRGKFGTRTSL